MDEDYELKNYESEKIIPGAPADFILENYPFESLRNSGIEHISIESINV